MRTLSIIILFTLVSCGKHATDPKTGSPLCRSREEQRALCFVEEMDKLGHDQNMTNWVINQCAIWYATEGCYR